MARKTVEITEALARKVLKDRKAGMPWLEVQEKYGITRPQRRAVRALWREMGEGDFILETGPRAGGKKTAKKTAPRKPAAKRTGKKTTRKTVAKRTAKKTTARKKGTAKRKSTARRPSGLTQMTGA